MHKGIDISSGGIKGKDILAVYDGVVSYAGDKKTVTESTLLLNMVTTYKLYTRTVTIYLLEQETE
ncbi:hypothetical protein FACS189465_3340 [Clostridia bacterium]|nr:hypothetical protein FACS189465_3340 [Clostridia bacterium]